MTKEHIEEKLKIYLDKNDFNIPTFEDMVNFAQEVEEKAIKELKEENAELRTDLNNHFQADNYIVSKIYDELETLRKENAELKRQGEQLTKAKEIIKSSIVLLTKPRTALDTKTYLMKAEQFLNGEVEND